MARKRNGDGSYSPSWVCAICGVEETKWCKHKDTEFYALIDKAAYKSVQKEMQLAATRSNANIRRSTG